MPMKAYSNDTYGPSTYQQVGGFPITSNRVIARRTLSNVWSVSGNFRTFNPHTYVKTVDRGLIGREDSYSNGRWFSSRHGSMPYVYNWNSQLPQGFDPDARSVALEEAYEKLRGEVDLSIDLVQWRQTVQMVSLHRRLIRGIALEAKRMIPLVDTVKDLQKSLTDPKIGRRRARRIARKLNSTLNAIARARLEAVYGWMPMASTIHDLALQTLTPDAPGLLVVEGKSKIIRRIKKESFAISARVPLIHYIMLSDKARVVMFFNPQPTVMTMLGKITSLNPVSVLYEACPFSLVLDWAWGVSTWLRTVETAFLHRNDFAGGWQDLTRRYAVESVMSGTDRSSGNWSSGTWTTFALQGEGTLTARSRSNFGFPPWPARPVRQFKFGSEKMLNAMALTKATLLDADALLAGRRR